MKRWTGLLHRHKIWRDPMSFLRSKAVVMNANLVLREGKVLESEHLLRNRRNRPSPSKRKRNSNFQMCPYRASDAPLRCSHWRPYSTRLPLLFAKVTVNQLNAICIRALDSVARLIGGREQYSNRSATSSATRRSCPTGLASLSL